MPEFPSRKRKRQDASVMLRDLYERAKAIADNLNVMVFNLNRAKRTDIPLAKAVGKKDPSLTETWRLLDDTAELSGRLLDYFTSADAQGGRPVRVLAREIDREPPPPKSVPRAAPQQMFDPRKARKWGPNELSEMSRRDLVIVCGAMKINPFTLPDQKRPGLIRAILDAQGSQETP